MNSKTILDRLRHIIIDAAELGIEVEEIKPETALFEEENGGLALDSLAMLSIIVQVSREFGIVIDDLPPSALVSVASLAEFIELETSTAESSSKENM